MAWVFALGVTVVLVVGAAVVLVGSGSGDTHRVTPAHVSAPGPAAAASATPTDPAQAATALQVQEVLTGIITRLQTPAADGQTKAVTPAEIDAQVQAELAKIGLHR